MINSIQRDHRRRLLAYKFEQKTLQYKALLQDTSLPMSIKQEKGKRYKRVPRNSSLTRLRNRCILTGRSRGVLRFCKLSRIRLRELASQGLLIGVKQRQVGKF